MQLQHLLKSMMIHEVRLDDKFVLFTHRLHLPGFSPCSQRNRTPFHVSTCPLYGPYVYARPFTMSCLPPFKATPSALAFASLSFHRFPSCEAWCFLCLAAQFAFWALLLGQHFGQERLSFPCVPWYIAGTSSQNTSQTSSHYIQYSGQHTA